MRKAANGQKATRDGAKKAASGWSVRKTVFLRVFKTRTPGSSDGCSGGCDIGGRK